MLKEAEKILKYNQKLKPDNKGYQEAIENDFDQVLK